MSYIRTKSVDLGEGASILIGGLSMGYIENFILRQADIKTDSDEGRKAWSQVVAEFVCKSLNRADPDGNWTPEKLKEELDMNSYKELVTKILEFNKLASSEKAGEAKATS